MTPDVRVRRWRGANGGLGIFTAGSLRSAATNCTTGVVVDDVEETTVQPGSATLTYDPLTQRYQYVWQTSNTWAGTCRTLRITFTDGTTHEARFTFR